MDNKSKFVDYSVGAIWKKQSEKGKYFWGKITIDGNEVIFTGRPNNYKYENPQSNSPDLKLYLVTKKGNKTKPAPKKTTPKPPIRPDPEIVEEEDDSATF